MGDFAVGLSRQLYGLTMHSERPRHRMYEQWHPLGVVGIITAFNFPVAVWAWNAMIAAVCGDTMIWKPSSLTPLCAIAVQNIVNSVMDAHGLRGVFSLAIGRGSTVGERMINDRRVSRSSARPDRRRWASGSARCRRRAPRPLHPRAGRQQRDHRHGRCRPGPRPARDPLRRRRHGGAALHLHPADHHAQGDRRADSPSKLGRRLQDDQDRRSARPDDPDGAAGRRGRGRHDDEGPRGGPRAGGRDPLRRQARSTGPASTSSRRSCSAKPGHEDRPRGDLRADPLSASPSTRSTRRSRSTTASTRGSRARSSRGTCRRPRRSSRTREATAASPTSTSAPRARRSAAPSAARRRRAAGARPGATPGRSTCAARPTRSTGATTCRWRRASSSATSHNEEEGNGRACSRERRELHGDGGEGRRSPRCSTSEPPGAGRARRWSRRSSPWRGSTATRSRSRRSTSTKSQQVALRFGIMAVPTVIFFKGGKEVHRFSGAAVEGQDHRADRDPPTSGVGGSPHAARSSACRGRGGALVIHLLLGGWDPPRTGGPIRDPPTSSAAGAAQERSVLIRIASDEHAELVRGSRIPPPPSSQSATDTRSPGVPRARSRLICGNGLDAEVLSRTPSGPGVRLRLHGRGGRGRRQAPHSRAWDGCSTEAPTPPFWSIAAGIGCGDRGVVRPRPDRRPSDRLAGPIRSFRCRPRRDRIR